MQEYKPIGEYKGLQFPIQRIAGSKWVVVDEVWFPRHSSYAPGNLHSIGIHYDADNPIHTFLGPENWKNWPNARKLADWYNAPHTKSMRMRRRRSTECTKEDFERIEREYLAIHALELTKLITEFPDDEHFVGDLEWNPTGQVWKDGKRWVNVKPD